MAGPRSRPDIDVERVPGRVDKHPHDLLVRLGIGSEGTEAEQLRLGRVEVGDAQAEMRLGGTARPGCCPPAFLPLEPKAECALAGTDCLLTRVRGRLASGHGP